MTDYYWFNAEKQIFFGPNSIGHADLYLKDSNLSFIVDELMGSDEFQQEGDVYDKLLQNRFVRMYYNPASKELGIHSLKHLDAIKATKAFQKQKTADFNSLFIDINEICIRQELSGKSLTLYLKTGRIKQI